MWIATVEREQLLRLLQGERLHLYPVWAENFDQIGVIQRKLVAVWRDQPGAEWELPNMFIVPKEEKHEFFAWSTSFLKIKPLTALIRVLDQDAFRAFAKTKPTRANQQIVQCVTGLIIAEALTHLEQSAVRLTLRTCESTFSFAVGKSILAVMGARGLGLTGSNWFRARQFLGNRLSRLRQEDLQRPWSVILHLLGYETDEFDVSPVVLSCMNDLYKMSALSSEHWRNLTIEYPDIRAAEELMRDTREERVVVLERMLRSLASNMPSREYSSFLAGYLVSLVAPGTLDHWKLLDPVRNVMPAAGLWYGVCAAARKESQVLNYGGGLGRLIARELERKIDLVERPFCDVSIDEIEFLGPMPRMDLVATAASANVEVEISPGVSVPFRSGSRDQGVTTSEPYLDFGQPRIPEKQINPAILDVLNDVIEDLRQIKQEVQRSGAAYDEGEFKKPRKKKAKH